jgi:hypothetical protein
VDELPLSSASAATPATVTGFNLDVIAEYTPISAATTGAVDGSDYVLYVPSTFLEGGGLPASGTITAGARTWQLAPFGQVNALRLNAGQSGRLVLSPQVPASSVSLLGLSTEGSSTLSVVLHTSAGALPARTLSLPDWFIGQGAVLSGFGRAGRTTGVRDAASAAPHLHSLFLELGCSKPLATLREIVITNTSTGGANVVIFAVSVGQ